MIVEEWFMAEKTCPRPSCKTNLKTQRGKEKFFTQCPNCSIIFHSMTAPLPTTLEEDNQRTQDALHKTSLDDANKTSRQMEEINAFCRIHVKNKPRQPRVRVENVPFGGIYREKDTWVWFCSKCCDGPLGPNTLGCPSCGH